MVYLKEMISIIKHVIMRNKLLLTVVLHHHMTVMLKALSRIVFKKLIELSLLVKNRWHNSSKKNKPINNQMKKMSIKHHIQIVMKIKTMKRRRRKRNYMRNVLLIQVMNLKLVPILNLKD